MRATRNFFLLLGGTIGLFLAWYFFHFRFPEWVNIGICLWLFLLGPALLILTAQDAKLEIDYENPTGLKGIFLRATVSSQLGCAGVVLMVAAIGVFALLAFQSIAKHDFSWLESAQGLGIFATMFLFGIGLFVMAMKRTGPTREEYEKQEAAYWENLANPDWNWYGRHLDRPVPEALIRFFESFTPRSDPDFELGFIPQPIKSHDCRKGADYGLEFDFLPIATDLDDHLFFLIPGRDNDDGIYLVFPDGAENGPVPVAEDFDAFLVLQQREEDE